MSKSKKQLKKDLKYLKKHLDDNKEINQIIEHTTKIGISSAQYFCEEFPELNEDAKLELTRQRFEEVCQ